MTDLINHPPHYTQHPSGIESIKIAQMGGFNLGNAIKYLYRHEHKGDPISDLKKARFYLQRLTELDAIQIELINSHDTQGAINQIQEVLKHEPANTPLHHALRLLQTIIFSAGSPSIQIHGPKAVQAINQKLTDLEPETHTPKIYEEQ
ncbi:DUF3310 domain-containing protein [Rothia sp. P5764]|uniref:DUF3310 domain-containing protein n=1 Tax=Rothia sp. P5764 TaxID=3402654 RepID=UPI003ACC12C4